MTRLPTFTLIGLVAGAASCLSAGTVKGVVLEHLSGLPVARTVVRLDPVPKPGGTNRTLTTRARRGGDFVFPSVAAGIYILSATRSGYFPAAYGQRVPVGRGKPIDVTADSELFAELRLRHKGAITGRVLDENGVGTADVPVVAYRARLPFRSAGTGRSDDRGVFRIPGLEPGKYWVRSGAHTMDDGSGWLPTFGPRAFEIKDAHVHKVTVDTDTAFADVSPEPGSLFSLGGLLTCDTVGPAMVTLSSETGRRRVQAACPGEYRFDGLAPAVYEVFATLQGGAAAGFTQLYLNRSTRAMNVHITELPRVEIEVRKSGTRAPDIPVQIIGRRQDLSETETAREIAGPRVALAPGYWELRARVPQGHYVNSITNQFEPMRRPMKTERPADWYEIFIEQRSTARVTVSLSDKAGEITGTVQSEGQAVAGVPVFLWSVSESARRSLGGPLQGITDTGGHFRFDSLPPGDYRMLASFDVYEIDEDLIEESRATMVQVEALKTASTDLRIWEAPW